MSRFDRDEYHRQRAKLAIAELLGRHLGVGVSSAKLFLSPRGEWEYQHVTATCWARWRYEAERRQWACIDVGEFDEWRVSEVTGPPF